MPSTSAGVSYTTTAYPLGVHGTGYITAPTAASTTPDVPWVLYTHGSGGAGNQFAALGAWTKLREWLINQGWVIVEGTGGGLGTLKQWGSPASRAAYEAYVAKADTLFDLGVGVLLGRSMGGLVAAWLYAHSTIRHRFSGMISNSAVGTWFEGGTLSVPGVERSSLTYFGSSADVQAEWGVTTQADLRAAIEAADGAPEAWDPSVWDGLNILSLYGDADTTVPWWPRGASKLRELWSGLPAMDLVSVTPGGAHGGAITTYDSPQAIAAMTSFFTTLAGGVEPPVTATELLDVIESYVRAGGLWFPTSIAPTYV